MERRSRPRATVDPPDGDNDNPGPESPFDGIPEEVVAAARAAFGPLEPGELAVVTFDSLVDEDDAPEDHRLRFEHPALQVDLRLSVHAGGASLSGHLTPSGPARVELDLEGADLAFVDNSSDGSFTFGPVGHGLLRLLVTAAGSATTVRTDWFRV